MHRMISLWHDCTDKDPLIETTATFTRIPVKLVPCMPRAYTSRTCHPGRDRPHFGMRRMYTVHEVRKFTWDNSVLASCRVRKPSGCAATSGAGTQLPLRPLVPLQASPLGVASFSGCSPASPVEYVTLSRASCGMSGPAGAGAELPDACCFLRGGCSPRGAWKDTCPGPWLLWELMGSLPENSWWDPSGDAQPAAPVLPLPADSASAGTATQELAGCMPSERTQSYAAITRLSITQLVRTQSDAGRPSDHSCFSTLSSPPPVRRRVPARDQQDLPRYHTKDLREGDAQGTPCRRVLELCLCRGGVFLFRCSAGFAHTPDTFAAAPTFEASPGEGAGRPLCHRQCICEAASTGACSDGALQLPLGGGEERLRVCGPQRRVSARPGAAA